MTQQYYVLTLINQETESSNKNGPFSTKIQCSSPVFNTFFLACAENGDYYR